MPRTSADSIIPESQSHMDDDSDYNGNENKRVKSKGMKNKGNKKNKKYQRRLRMDGDDDTEMIDENDNNDSNSNDNNNIDDDTNSQDIFNSGSDNDMTMNVNDDDDNENDNDNDNEDDDEEDVDIEMNNDKKRTSKSKHNRNRNRRDGDGDGYGGRGRRARGSNTNAKNNKNSNDNRDDNDNDSKSGSETETDTEYDNNMQYSKEPMRKGRRSRQSADEIVARKTLENRQKYLNTENKLLKKSRLDNSIHTSLALFKPKPRIRIGGSVKYEPRTNKGQNSNKKYGYIADIHYKGYGNEELTLKEKNSIHQSEIELFIIWFGKDKNNNKATSRTGYYTRSETKTKMINANNYNDKGRWYNANDKKIRFWDRNLRKYIN